MIDLSSRRGLAGVSGHAAWPNRMNLWPEGVAILRLAAVQATVMSLITVVTTLPTRERALKLARTLVEQRLVACAQLSAIESLYIWDGQLQQDPEVRLTLKAPESHYDAIEAAILEQHPYDLPAIHAQRLDRVHQPYDDWIRGLERQKGAATRE
jgi:periplasmic divalent cation tolerance protein